MASDAESAPTTVCVRFRPKSSKESGALCVNCLSDKQVRFNGMESGDSNMFTFDKVYDQRSTQEQVFDDMKHVIGAVLQGYNGTILAYGQTGSGKTHTLIGELNDPELRGVVPRAIGELAHGIQNDASGCEYLVKVSAVEIYCERICDLLDSSNFDLQVKQDPDRGIYVAGATEIPVSSEEQLVNIMEMAISNRAVCSTGMNAASSRSHCIVYITVEKSLPDNSVQYGKLCMVDLAGSERQTKTGATGLTLDEGILINKSLSALANVISALTESKAKYVPYRDSKLTRVLQDSLGGSAKTTLIVCCSPCMDNAPESLSSLRFGSRAQGITNTVQVNVRGGNDALEEQLWAALQQCEDLKKELKDLRENGHGNQRMRRRLLIDDFKDVKTEFQLAVASVGKGDGEAWKHMGTAGRNFLRLCFVHPAIVHVMSAVVYFFVEDKYVRSFR